MGSIATIIRSMNPEDNDKIDLTSTFHDAAVGDVTQQLSDIKIDESRFLNVGGFIFALSQFGNTKDLTKALEEELLGSTDDVPLRFFSVKMNGLIAAATKIGLLTIDNYCDIEARHKKNSWDVVFHLK